MATRCYVVVAVFLVSSCTVASKTDHPLHSVYGDFDPLMEGPPQLTQVPTARVNASLAAPPAPNKIVQFQDPIDADISAMLRREHVRVLGYVPDNALLVQMSREQQEAVAQWPMVRAVIDQPTAFKLDRRLMVATPKGYVLPQGSARRPYAVELNDASRRGGVVTWVYRLGGDVEREHATDLRLPSQDRTLRILLAPRDLAALANHRDVRYISPRARHRLLNDRAYGIVQAGKRNVSPIWAQGLLGAGQIVALCDSGVDMDTCYFQEDKVVDYQDLTESPDGDGDGHGTHVAGSIAGDKGSNRQYDTHDGMAPAARLVVQDIAEGSELTGLGDDLTDLFAAAYDKGARIHSNSWGDEIPPTA